MDYLLILVLLYFADGKFPIWIHFRKSCPWGIALLDFFLFLWLFLLLFLLYLT
jgi:hypothetical protein